MDTELALLALDGSWDTGLADQLGALGPWLLGLAWVALLLRAAGRRQRYDALSVLGPEACERVRRAIAAAERRTVGEIVPVVVERSDPHPGAAWMVALLHLLVGSLLLMPVLPWDHPLLLLTLQLSLGAVGWILARLLPELASLAIPARRAAAVAREQALQEFHGLGLQETASRTGVLLFVSLLEHQIVVLGDKGIDRAMGPEHWLAVTDKVREGIAAGDLGAGLESAVAEIGRVLEQHFPWVDGDRNELPDRLIVRRE